MTEIERFRVRLLRANHALLGQAVIRRWLKEIAVSVLNRDGNSPKLAGWLQHHKLSELDVIFIRNDGWTLGAKRNQVAAAERTWHQQWLYVAEAPRFNAVPYGTWISKQEIPKDWTGRANFHSFKLESGQVCKGCGNGMSRQRPVLRAQFIGRGGARRALYVCDDRCWETWNERYWQAKAAQRQEDTRSNDRRTRALAKGGYPVRGGNLP